MLQQVQNSLRERQKADKRKTQFFTEATYKPTYLAVINALDELQVKNPDAWEAMMDEYATQQCVTLTIVPHLLITHCSDLVTGKRRRREVAAVFEPSTSSDPK